MQKEVVLSVKYPFDPNGRYEVFDLLSFQAILNALVI